jgi:hypothetical protein
MNNWNYDAPWYHGSPDGTLTTLRAGSAITQNRSVARAFSHKPSIVAGEGSTVSHNGTIPDGYLYRVSERVTEDDATCTPFPGNEERSEWLITRDLSVERIARTTILPEELLSTSEVEAMKRKAYQLRRQN